MNKGSRVREEALTRPNPVALLGLTVGFVALSVGTPYAVHMLGGPALGRTFLPMHFFILFSGLLLGWQPGLAVGVLSPLISFGLSGMPPAHLLLPLTLEMSTYGLVAGVMTRSLKKNLWFSLAVALVAGRIVVAAAVLAMGIQNPVSYMTSSLIAGLPGIAAQLAFLPVIVTFFNRKASR